MRIVPGQDAPRAPTVQQRAALRIDLGTASGEHDLLVGEKAGERVLAALPGQWGRRRLAVGWSERSGGGWRGSDRLAELPDDAGRAGTAAEPGWAGGSLRQLDRGRARVRGGRGPREYDHLAAGRNAYPAVAGCRELLADLVLDGVLDITCEREESEHRGNRQNEQRQQASHTKESTGGSRQTMRWRCRTAADAIELPVRA